MTAMHPARNCVVCPAFKAGQGRDASMQYSPFSGVWQAKRGSCTNNAVEQHATVVVAALS